MKSKTKRVQPPSWSIQGISDVFLKPRSPNSRSIDEWLPYARDWLLHPASTSSSVSLRHVRSIRVSLFMHFLGGCNPSSIEHEIPSGIEYGLLDNTYPVGMRIDHDVGDPRTLLAAANRVETDVSALGLRPDQWQTCRPLFWLKS